MEALKNRSRVARLGGALVAAALAAGCSSPPPPPPPPAPKAPELSAETSQKIDEALDYLNNPNVEERWRNQLIACAQEGDLARRAVIDRTVERVKKSYDLAGRGGPGVLKPAGRRRAFEVLDKVGGDEPAVLEVLKQGARASDAEECAAAAAALAARGDEKAFQTLVSATALASDDAQTQARGTEALVRLAKPERLPLVLQGVDPRSRRAFAPVVLACLPKEEASRAFALRQIAREDANPQARILALEELAKAKDAELPSLARAAATASDPALRAYGLGLLVERGGDAAADELAHALEQDPADAASVAALLAKLDSPKTVESACRILDDASRKPATRAAVAREVLGKVRDPAAPSALRSDAARTRAVASLRRALDDSDATVGEAATAALGRSGDESDAEVLALHVASWKDARAVAAVRALGQLGGARASFTLIELHGKDATLRPTCREALTGMKGLARIPGDQGFALIRQLASPDADVRKSAIVVLRALKGDVDVFDYDPNAVEAARGLSIERWRKWWRENLVARGG